MSAVDRRWLRMVMLGSVAATVSASAVQAQEFRDPTTGQVWTQENVGKESRPLNWPSGPVTPADRWRPAWSQAAAPPRLELRAFDPNNQVAVPITASPAVPIATLESSALVVIPSDHWRTTLYVANNSARVTYPEINCQFMNAGRVVQNTHIVVPAVGPGQRVSVPVQGPRTDLFVDRVPCRLLTP